MRAQIFSKTQILKRNNFAAELIFCGDFSFLSSSFKFSLSEERNYKKEKSTQSNLTLILRPFFKAFFGLAQIIELKRTFLGAALKELSMRSAFLFVKFPSLSFP